MDMMTMLMFMMIMDGGFGRSSDSATQPVETNENDIWKALILTFPDIISAFKS